MRERYHALIDNPADLERILQAGAEKARSRATPFMRELREAVGLRNLAAQAGKARGDKSQRVSLPSFKQYRDTDGKFYFKLVDANGRLLLQSAAHESPKEAGLSIARLREAPASFAMSGAPGPGVEASDIVAALGLLAG
jgi:tryptophanyl-tRNA synthetase